MLLTTEQPTAGQLDWTNDGKLLLITFQRLIKEGGGHFSMWSKLHSENMPPKPPPFRKRKVKRNAFMHRYARFILDNHQALSTYEMAAQLGCGHQNISHLMKGLRIRNRGNKWTKGNYSQMQRHSLTILDLETGIYYHSAREYSEAVNISYNIVKNVMLNRSGKKWLNRFWRVL